MFICRLTHTISHVHITLDSLLIVIQFGIPLTQIGVLDGNSCDHSDGHITSHDKPIRVALYNENFSQVRRLFLFLVFMLSDILGVIYNLVGCEWLCRCCGVCVGRGNRRKGDSVLSIAW